MANRKQGLIALGALVLAGALLYYALRGTDWPRLGGLLRGARWSLAAMTLGLGTVTLGLRALRWRVLLQAEGKVAPALAFWATAAGYFGNNILPARAGEVVRTLMISSGSGFSRSFVLATAMSERMADAVVLVLISAIALLTGPVRAGWLAAAARPFAAIGLAGVFAIAVLPRLEFLIREDWLGEKITGMVTGALRGLRAFHDPSRLAQFLGFTVAIWVLDAAGSVICARAIGLEMPWVAAFLLMAGLGLGSALPSTPGYVGIYQFVAVGVLPPFGFSRTDAIAYILLAQAISWLTIAFWGGLGLYRSRTRNGSGG